MLVPGVPDVGAALILYQTLAMPEASVGFVQEIMKELVLDQLFGEMLELMGEAGAVASPPVAVVKLHVVE